MKQRFELEDKNGRYSTCEYDKDQEYLSITIYLSPRKDVSIEELLSDSGYTIISRMNVQKPKIVSITKGKDE